MEPGEQKNVDRYDPSEHKRDTIVKLGKRMVELQSLRDQVSPHFQGRSLVRYIDDSVKRWNGIIPPRDNLSLSWESRVFNNFTRNTCLSFLSKVAMKRPTARFVATNKSGFQDTLRAHILEKGIEYTRNKEDGNRKFFYAALECVTKGTVVVYEGYKKVERKVEEIEKFDFVTGEYKAKSKTILDYNDCFQDVCALEDIFFGNTWDPDVQDQPDMVWRRLYTKSSFFEEWGKYPDTKYVKPGAYSYFTDTNPYYKQRMMDQMGKDLIEVLAWYKKSKDRLIIVANGILIYEGPFPFHHKMYPFAVSIFEPFDANCIYGKSLPDKIASDQDIINTFWNMMINQTKLSIYKPVLNQDRDPLDEYILQSGRQIQVKSVDDIKILDIPGPDASAIEMLNMAVRFANDNSGNLMQGVAATQASGKGKVTARQAAQIQEQMLQMIGVNVAMFENLEVQELRLRSRNFLQFYTVPEKNEAITGEKDAMNNFIRVMRVDNTELSDGTHGTSVLKIAKKKDLPPNIPGQPNAADIEEEVAAMQGENIEVHIVTPEYIRDQIAMRGPKIWYLLLFFYAQPQIFPNSYISHYWIVNSQIVTRKNA